MARRVVQQRYVHPRPPNLPTRGGRSVLQQVARPSGRSGPSRRPGSAACRSSRLARGAGAPSRTRSVARLPAWPVGHADGRPRSTLGSTSPPHDCRRQPCRLPRPPSSGTRGSAPPASGPSGRRRMADAPSAPKPAPGGRPLFCQTGAPWQTHRPPPSPLRLCVPTRCRVPAVPDRLEASSAAAALRARGSPAPAVRRRVALTELQGRRGRSRDRSRKTRSATLAAAAASAHNSLYGIIIPTAPDRKRER